MLGVVLEHVCGIVRLDEGIVLGTHQLPIAESWRLTDNCNNVDVIMFDTFLPIINICCWEQRPMTRQLAYSLRLHGDWRLTRCGGPGMRQYRVTSKETDSDRENIQCGRFCRSR